MPYIPPYLLLVAQIVQFAAQTEPEGHMRTLQWRKSIRMRMGEKRKVSHMVGTKYNPTKPSRFGQFLLKNTSGASNSRAFNTNESACLDNPKGIHLKVF
jgi:hypothetical protein